MIDHPCHAEGCDIKIPPAMFMCRGHWRMVPPKLQKLVWEAYRPGQEVRKDPTERYLKVARKAIKAVAKAEGR